MVAFCNASGVVALASKQQPTYTERVLSLPPPNVSWKGPTQIPDTQWAFIRTSKRALDSPEGHRDEMGAESTKSE